MIVHEVFAQIYMGEVKNIMVCENYPTADYLTKCIYGNDAFAVDCLQYRVGIGDKYHDNMFFRITKNEETGEESEEVISPDPTEEQQVQMLTQGNENLTLTLADMIGGAI